MALLEVVELRTQFDTKEGVIRAVDGVSIELNPGETLGLVGESGSGKSVTALSLMRLVPSPPGRIVGGNVFFDGRDLLQMDEDEMRQIRGKRIAMIFQDPMTTLNPLLPIGKQISEVMEHHMDMNRATSRSRTVELLDMVGIPRPDRHVDSYPHQFSGGMRQRISIAMALSCKPEIIIADEITTALDVTIQAQVLDLLQSLSEALGMAILLISHDLGVVAGKTDRVHVMYAGQIVEKAETLSLFEDPKMPYTWGLLRSTLRGDVSRDRALVPIEGQPPRLDSIGPGCRFEPRCPHKQSICSQENPVLEIVPGIEGEHAARCWGTQEGTRGGWLVDEPHLVQHTHHQANDSTSNS